MILALAARQHGVVTRSQLLAGGVTSKALYHRVRSGWLRQVHRGVYGVQPFAGARAREMAALLACGRTASVSHRSAGLVWHVDDEFKAEGPVEVTLGAGNRRRPGIRIRRIGTLASDEVTTLEGLRVTTPARTLFDLSTVLAPRKLEHALARAYAEQLTTPEQVRALLDRHRGRRGSRVLRTLVDAGDPALTRSEAEKRFLALIDKTDLPRPEVNVEVAGVEVDFLFRAARLVVEIDGRRYHTAQSAFEKDRLRDAKLATAGYRVLRITWRRLTQKPEAVLVQLGQFLGLASSDRFVARG